MLDILFNSFFEEPFYFIISFLFLLCAIWFTFKVLTSIVGMIKNLFK